MTDEWGQANGSEKFRAQEFVCLHSSVSQSELLHKNSSVPIRLSLKSQSLELHAVAVEVYSLQRGQRSQLHQPQEVTAVSIHVVMK